MDELRQLAESLKELVACDLEIGKGQGQVAQTTLERSSCLYRKCARITGNLGGLLLERFTREAAFNLRSEILQMMKPLWEYHRKVISSSYYVSSSQDEEQLVQTKLKEVISKLLATHEKNVIAEITSEALLGFVHREDSEKFDILINLWRLGYLYMVLSELLQSICKGKRFPKAKLIRFLQNFNREPPELAAQLGWSQIKNQVKEIDIAIQKPKKGPRPKDWHETKEYSHGAALLHNILAESWFKTTLLIARFSISKRLKAEAWLSSFPCATKQYSAEEFEYEALTYRFSRMGIDSLEISETVYKPWQAEFQRLDREKTDAMAEGLFKLPISWDYLPWNDTARKGFDNVVSMIRFAEWAEIGQFDGVFEDKLKKFEKCLKAPDIIYSWGLLNGLFLGCRSGFILERSGSAMEWLLDYTQNLYKDKLTPWTDSMRFGDSENLNACYYLFAVAMLGRFKKHEYLHSQAMKSILTKQNSSGWWPLSDSSSFIPSLQTTAVAIQTLCLLQPRGWRLAVPRGLKWLWSQQDVCGAWSEGSPNWPSSDDVWLTVLILDAIDLAEGKTKLTFKLPQAVTQRITPEETEKDTEIGLQQAALFIKRTRGRPIDSNRDKIAKQIMEFRNEGGKNWEEVSKKFGITSADAQQKVRRYKERKRTKRTQKGTSK